MEFERSNFWNVVYCKRAQNSVHFTESMHKTSCLRRATRLLNADSVSFFLCVGTFENASAPYSAVSYERNTFDLNCSLRYERFHYYYIEWKK